MLKSVLAVIAGFFAMGLGVNLATAAAVKAMLGGFHPDTVPTPAYLAVNITYSFFFAIVGGYVAARLAPRAPDRHAAWLAGTVVFLGVVGLLVAGGVPPGQPGWYPYTMTLLGAAGVLLGGRLRLRQLGA